MLKIKFIIRVMICVLSVVTYSACWARPIPVTIKCSPSREAAKKTGWKEVAGKPNVRLSLTSEGIEVAGEKELVTIWDDFKKARLTNYASLHSVDGESPIIIAQCTPNGEYMNMYPVDGFTPGKGPTLICQLGEGIRMNMIGPNAPDPKKYIWHAMLNRDEINTPNLPSSQVGDTLPIQEGVGVTDPMGIVKQFPQTPVSVGGLGSGGSPQ